MGTVISIDIRAPFIAEAALEEAVAVLHDIDRRFSLYRPESELSRYGRGELREADLSADIQWVLGVCDALALSSEGAFDARRHRADGVVDPSGFVKGWAVERAADRLEAAGACNFSIAAGGDVLTRGEPLPGTAWRVGVRHPDEEERLATVLEIHRGAVATSGLYERGDHIVDPRSGKTPRDLVSLTVVGPDLGWADAYATAAFAMGVPGVAWVEAHPGYGAVGITATAELLWSAAAAVRRAPDLEGMLTAGAGFSGSSQPTALS